MTSYSKHALFLIVAFAIFILIGGWFFMQENAQEPPEDSIGEFWGSVQGTVLLGPTCPVMRDPPDPECADKPYSARLAITVDDSRVIKEFSSDASGKFNVELPPGEYTIISATAANMLPYCSSNTFRVHANDYTDIIVSCDTGIR